MVITEKDINGLKKQRSLLEREAGRQKEMSTRKMSDLHESSVARSVGGSKVVGSGACNWWKGDVTTEEFIIECKTRMVPSDSISMKRDWFDVLEDNRSKMKKSYAAVCFSFGDGKDYYAMDEKTFKFLLAISRGEE